jgi:hypothetical protein
VITLGEVPAPSAPLAIVACHRAALGRRKALRDPAQCGREYDASSGYWLSRARVRIAAVAKGTPAVIREYLRTLGAKGGKAAAGKGARVRFRNMTAEERSKLAKKAARVRWAKKGAVSRGGLAFLTRLRSPPCVVDLSLQ